MNTQILILAGQAPLASVPPVASAADLEWLANHHHHAHDVYAPFWNSDHHRPTVWDELLIHQVHTDKEGFLTTGFGRSLTHQQDDASSLFGPELGLGWEWLSSTEHDDDSVYDQILFLDLTTTEDQAGSIEWASPRTMSDPEQAGTAYTTMINTVLDTLDNVQRKNDNAGNPHAVLDVAGLIWMPPPRVPEDMEDFANNVEHWIQDVRLDLDLPHLPVVVAAASIDSILPSTVHLNLDHVHVIAPPTMHSTVHNKNDILQEETELARFMIDYGRRMGQGLQKAMETPKPLEKTSDAIQVQRNLQTDMQFSLFFQFGIYPNSLNEADECNEVVEQLVQKAYNASTTCTDGSCLKIVDIGIPKVPPNYFLLAQSDELTSSSPLSTAFVIQMQGACDSCTASNLLSPDSTVVPSDLEFITNYNFEIIELGGNCGDGLSIANFAVQGMVTNPCSDVQEDYTEDLSMNVTFVDNRVIDAETMQQYRISLTQMAIATYNEENELNAMRCDPNHNILNLPDWASVTAGTSQRQLVVVKNHHRGRRGLKSDSKETKSGSSSYYAPPTEGDEEPDYPYPTPRTPKSTKSTKSTKGDDGSRKKSTKSSSGRKPKSIKSTSSSRSPSTRAPTMTSPPTGGTVITLSTPVPGTCIGMGCSDMSIFSDGTARRVQETNEVNPQDDCQCPIGATSTTPPSVKEFTDKFNALLASEQTAGRFTEILKIDFM